MHVWSLSGSARRFMTQVKYRCEAPRALRRLPRFAAVDLHQRGKRRGS
jgi:hypothetical protein